MWLRFILNDMKFVHIYTNSLNSIFAIRYTTPDDTFGWVWLYNSIHKWMGYGFMRLTRTYTHTHDSIRTSMNVYGREYHTECEYSLHSVNMHITKYQNKRQQQHIELSGEADTSDEPTIQPTHTLVPKWHEDALNMNVKYFPDALLVSFASCVCLLLDGFGLLLFLLSVLLSLPPPPLPHWSLAHLLSTFPIHQCSTNDLKLIWISIIKHACINCTTTQRKRVRNAIFSAIFIYFIVAVVVFFRCIWTVWSGNSGLAINIVCICMCMEWWVL